MEKITIRREESVAAQDMADIFRSSGLTRPIDDLDRIQRMIDNSNLILCAYDGEKMVGIARCLTDFSFATYLSDLAVREEYKCQGIGKRLIQAVIEEIGPESMLFLSAGRLARDYYPHIGFQHAPHAWTIDRKK